MASTTPLSDLKLPPPTRRGLLLGVAAAGAFASTAKAEAPVLSSGADVLEKIDWRADPSGRITADVLLNGQGPFRFFVDTGANASVLSASTAAQIGAVAAGDIKIHGVGGSDATPSVIVSSLRCGAFEQTNVRTPVLADDFLAPAQGLIGMSPFSGLRLEIDNRSRTMVVRRSGRDWPRALATPITIRHGQLVSAKGRIGNAPVTVIFDTGADLCLANKALYDALREPIPPTASMAGYIATATQRIYASHFLQIPLLRLEGCGLKEIEALVGDFHVFDIWDLRGKPALVVGMPILRLMSRFAIDYGKRQMQFES